MYHSLLSLQLSYMTEELDSVREEIVKSAGWKETFQLVFTINLLVEAFRHCHAGSKSNFSPSKSC